MNVARLAGLPDGVIKRAASFAARMEADHERRLAGGGGAQGPPPAEGALSVSAPDAALLTQLRAALGPADKASGFADVLRLWHSAQSVAVA